MVAAMLERKRSSYRCERQRSNRSAAAKSAPAKGLDCFVALLLAMTVAAIRILASHPLQNDYRRRARQRVA
jgi:hypothetical protein